MGIIFETIKLSNNREFMDSKEGLIKKSAVHRRKIKALIDTGCNYDLVIGEDLCKALNLRIAGRAPTWFADGKIMDYNLTEPIKAQWKNRSCICEAVVVPGNKEILLGVMPLEKMDLMIDMKEGEEKLIGRHGDLPPIGFIGPVGPRLFYAAPEGVDEEDDDFEDFIPA
jgi:clan AA aspartic protease